MGRPLQIQSFTILPVKNSKWIDNIPADATVQQAGGLILQNRLGMVASYLETIKTGNECHPEKIHQLRVATRRASAALKLLEKYLHKKQCTRMKKILNRIRRSAGSARELDVIIEEYSKSESIEIQQLMQRMRSQRDRELETMIAISREMCEEKLFLKQATKLSESLQKNSKMKSKLKYDHWARKQLKQVFRKFHNASPQTMDDIDLVHQFRIIGKQFRYTIELLGSAFPQKLRLQIYPSVERLLEQLGSYHDHYIAIERFQHWRKLTADAHEKTAFKDLINLERSSLEQERKRMSAWWSIAQQEKLEQQMRKLFERLKHSHVVVKEHD